jgi:hypothetical protein
MRPPRSFPEGTVERLEQALRGARSKAEFQRVQCVWLRVAQGSRPEPDRKSLECGPSRRWGIQEQKGSVGPAETGTLGTGSGV